MIATIEFAGCQSVTSSTNLRDVLGIFGKGPLEPDELRKQLFDAVARNNARKFQKLFDRHEAVLQEHALGWSQVPDTYRAALGWYGPGLGAVAQELARRGHRQLLERLDPPRNLVEEWGAALNQVDRHRAAGHFVEAAQLAESILARVAHLRGIGVDGHFARTLCRLGESLFHLGQMDAATARMREALACCEALGDHERSIVCLENLFEIQRYQGDSAGAAGSLEQAARLLERQGRTSQARTFRQQAAIVENGEPLCRVLCERGGETLELEDVPAHWQTVQVRFVFRRNRAALGASEAAVSLGIREGRAGNLHGALDHFERAGAIDPFNPWPHYHRGETLLHLGRYGEAATAFETTERLAPGFFHVRSDRWLADRLDARALSHEVFCLIRHLQNGSVEPEQVLPLASDALGTAGSALLRLFGGDALRALGRSEEAASWYREGVLAAEEPDVCTRLLTALATVLEDPSERTQMLQRAAELRGNLVAAATAELMLRISGASRRVH